MKAPDLPPLPVLPESPHGIFQPVFLMPPEMLERVRKHFREAIANVTAEWRMTILPLEPAVQIHDKRTRR